MTLQEIFSPSNYYFNPWAVPVFFTSLYGISMAFFVWSKNKSSIANTSFALVCLSSGMWLFFTVGMFMSKDEGLGLFWNKFIWMSIPFISPAIYFYSVSWLGLQKQKKIAAIIFLLALIFVLLAVNTKYVIVGAKKHFWGFYPEYGPLSMPFMSFHFLVMMGSFLNFIFVYKKSASLLQRRQIRYIFIAYLIAYLGSIDYLPALGIEIYPFGYIFVFACISIIAYTIVRYRVMEIDTVIHRTILWVLTSGLILVPIGTLLYFIRPWFSGLNWMQLTLVISVLFYVYLYYYHRMQPRIDHLFRRRKYDYQTILGKVAEKISATINIDDLTRKFLTEVCETMYLRNSSLYILNKDENAYFLIGRWKYREIESVRRSAEFILYAEEERNKLPEDEKGLLSANSLFSWIRKRQDILEKEQVEIDPQYIQVKQEALKWLHGQELELIVPLIFESKVHALLGLGKKENLQAYTTKDIELLKKLGQEAGVTIFNALHYEDSIEKERLEEELKMGRQIQMALLPQSIPQVPALIVRGLMQPAKEIGGDYYDFITLPDKQKLGIVIGDVSGKGVAAGLLMAMTKATIHTLSKENNQPKQILLKTNELLHQHIGGQKFMTLLYLMWNAQGKTLTYSSAGHEHILIYRSGGQGIESIMSGGFMLGMIPDIDRFLDEIQIKMESRDKILLYTDGVTEAENSDGDRLGLEKLKEVFLKHSQKPAAELMQAVKDEVYAFIGEHPQYDDITLVVLEAT